MAVNRIAGANGALYVDISTGGSGDHAQAEQRLGLVLPGVLLALVGAVAHQNGSSSP